MKDQQPPPPHQRDPELNPASTAPGNSSDETDVPSREVPKTTGPLYSRLSKAWQRATCTPPTWRTLAVCAVVVAVLAFMFGVRSPTPDVTPQLPVDTKQFSIASHPTLVFEHFIGNVNIKPGPSGQVTIKQKENGETDVIQMHYTQRGDTITVKVDIPGGLMQDTWVDFDVQVPAHAGVTTTMATGTLEATNLGGHIALSNTNGAIWATNLSGSIGLKTQSGSINLTNVTGQVGVFTENGTVTTTATHLQGHSSIQVENGTINFHGTLSRTGSYVFRNGNGAVGVTLPSNLAFALDARSASGSINSDFRGIAVVHENGLSQARGIVGTGAGASTHLIIQTAGGSIDLHQGR
jgi:hypothetical protein